MNIKIGSEVTILKNGKHGMVKDCFEYGSEKVYMIEVHNYRISRRQRKPVSSVQRYQCRREEIEIYQERNECCADDD